MKKRCIALILGLFILMLFSGCQRRLIPNQPVPNNNFRISAANDRADFYYGTVTNNTTAQTGSPTGYTVPSGNRVKIIGKYDGYYVVILPNNRMGLMPLNSTTPHAPGGTTVQQPANQGTPPTGTTGTQPGTSAGTTGSQPGTPTGSSTAGSGRMPDASTMISLVNQARAQAGLKALNAYGGLVNVANMKANDISANNYFSHTSPTYGSPFDMMKNNGIAYLYAGENLAINQNVQAAEQALMNSPEHKANILNPNYTDIGIGIAQKSDGSYVYVQEFIGR